MSKQKASYREICEQLEDFYTFTKLGGGNAYDYIIYIIRGLLNNSPDRRCTIEDVMFCLDDKAKQDKRLRTTITKVRVFQAIAYLARKGEIKRVRFILDGNP